MSTSGEPYDELAGGRIERGVAVPVRGSTPALLAILTRAPAAALGAPQLELLEEIARRLEPALAAVGDARAIRAARNDQPSRGRPARPDARDRLRRARGTARSQSDRLVRATVARPGCRRCCGARPSGGRGASSRTRVSCFDSTSAAGSPASQATAGMRRAASPARRRWTRMKPVGVGMSSGFAPGTAVRTPAGAVAESATPCVRRPSHQGAGVASTTRAGSPA